MTDIISINGTQINVVSENDTFVVSNQEVANAFKVGITSIQNMKNRNTIEILEGTHFVYVPNNTNGLTTMWTKKGIITLGFKLKTTPETIAFRDWASDYIIKTSVIPQNPMEALALFFDVSKEQESRIKVLEDTKRLESWQEASLVSAKNIKVYELAGANSHDKKYVSGLHRKVWSLFKKRFYLPRYNELPAIKHQEGLEFIHNLTIADMV